MLQILQVVTLMLVAVTMALALAHALEYPGKMRLSKQEYLATQAIYYPGFTLGGIAEGVSVIALGALAFLTAAQARPSGSRSPLSSRLPRCIWFIGC
jgi:hypothetical protein